MVGSNKSNRKGADATRQKIIDAACEIIGREGYEALTSASLIERAGVSKGGLYHHFTQLDDVVYAAFDTKLKENLTGIKAASYDSPLQYLEDLGNFLFENLLQDEQTLRLLYSFIPKAMFDAKYRKLLKSIFEDSGYGLSDGLYDLYERKIPLEKIKIATGMMDALWMGMTVQYRIHGNIETCRTMWKWLSVSLDQYLRDELTEAFPKKP